MSRDSTGDPMEENEIRPRELLVASVHDVAHLLVAQQFADHVLAEIHDDRLRCVTCGHEELLADVLGREAKAEANAPGLLRGAFGERVTRPEQTEVAGEQPPPG